MRNRHREFANEQGPQQQNWADYGFDSADACRWQALGFDPFEAAMAHGDGYTPMFATHYTGPLRAMASSWARVGLGTPEGLRWHLAGFAAKEAIRCRKLGTDVEAARTRRSGHDRAGTGR
jgi:hypothetical protein